MKIKQNSVAKIEKPQPLQFFLSQKEIIIKGNVFKKPQKGKIPPYNYLQPDFFQRPKILVMAT